MSERLALVTGTSEEQPIAAPYIEQPTTHRAEETLDIQEGRISHLKRRYGLKRSRLKGHRGARTWTAWAILAYNLDTLAIRTP